MGTRGRRLNNSAHGGIARPDIRLALESDARSIASLHVRSFQSAYAGLMPEDVLNGLDVSARTGIWADRIAVVPDHGGQILVSVAVERPIGFIYYGPSPDPDEDPSAVGHVFSFHVDPAVTGRGIGGHLLTRALENMEQRGFVEATLWVVEANPVARRFYERLGWCQDGARRDERLGLEEEPGPDIEVQTVRYRQQIGRVS